MPKFRSSKFRLNDNGELIDDCCSGKGWVLVKQAGSGNEVVQRCDKCINRSWGMKSDYDAAVAASRELGRRLVITIDSRSGRTYSLA
jgi:hypothetical protein